ncbi:MAG: hypothetical protein K9M54_02250 [Kiritimatiellales bacterium]|nr:hypothetical protein [Kiritimatiellales bacterium]
MNKGPYVKSDAFLAVVSKRRGWLRVATIGLFLAGTPVVVHAVDFSGVPGEVLAYVPLQYDLFYSTPRLFVADPDIVVLPNGDYVAGWAMAGRYSTSTTSGETKAYRSTDKGATWSLLGTYSDFLRASFFLHNGDLYYYGAMYEGGPSTIKKSTNGGTSWTTTANFPFGGPATPNNPVLFNNRWFCAVSTSCQSASAGSDLMLAASWTSKTGFPAQQPDWPTWPAEDHFIGEGQIVASPAMGVFLLPKVKNLNLTAVARVDSATGAVSFDPNRDFVQLPGADKKFGAAYDAGSGKFYILNNPVLPAHVGAIADMSMIRNTVGVWTSSDLYNWNLEKILLYTSDVQREGFGYPQFDFDGTNMAVVTRTSFKLPGETYPNTGRGGHDSNLMNFHLFPDFRNAKAEQVLRLESGLVKRHEITQYQAAPLGNFALGSSFAGAPLTNPNGFGKDSNGDVYIRETGGRILRFDAAGNFLGTTNAFPVSFQTAELAVDLPAGSGTWTKSGSGNWMDVDNWLYWRRADTVEETAVFGSAATAPATVTLSSLSREWFFETNGDFEGWTAANLAGATVAGGFVSGTASSIDPQLYRTDLSFPGSSAASVTLRMRAPTNNVPVDFYWGTTGTNTFHGARRITVNYTGNGEFQDLVFPTSSHAQWNGQTIRRIRFDPLNGPLVAVDIDSITLVKEPTRIKGLRFANAHSYTVSGTGFLALGSGAEPGSIDVAQGSHAVRVSVVLNRDTDVHVAAGCSLGLAGGLELAGKKLSFDGSGGLVVDAGRLAMQGGTLAIGTESTVVLTNSPSQLGGTLEIILPASSSPAAGDHFPVLGGSLYEGMFGQLLLPVLQEGLAWDASSLYVDGNIRVVARIPASWMASFGLPQDGSADFIDSDGDGQDNYSEWKAGTNPTNNLSFFMFDASGSLPVETGFQLRWNSLTGRTYRVEFSTNLTDNPPFTVLQSGIPGSFGTLDFIDTSATNKSQSFYRVYVE